VKAAIAKYKNIYTLQTQNISFTSPRELFQKIDLYNETQQSAYDYFDSLGVDNLFVEEFIDGASRDEYNQNGTINVFVDLVALAGAGVTGSVYQLTNGTGQLSQHLIQAAKSKVTTNASVTSIERCAPGAEAEFCVTYTDISTNAFHPETLQFDAVIIAAPLEIANMSLPQALLQPPPMREYRSVHITFVAGELSSVYFGAQKKFPGTILTPSSFGDKFSVIGYHGLSSDGHDVFKVTSIDPVSEETLNQLFSSVVEVKRLFWPAAYPMLQPSDKWPDFKLMDGLYYINAMESAVSCMEVEIISGMNAALLASEHLSPPTKPSAHSTITRYAPSFFSRINPF